MQGIDNRVPNQVHPFLGVQSTDIGHQGLVVFSHPQTFAQALFVIVLPVQCLNRVVTGNVGICFRIPHFVIEAVQHTTKFALMYVQGMAYTVAQLRVAGLPCMPRRHGVDKVGVDNGAFGEVDRAGIEIIPQAIPRVVVVRAPQTGGPENILASDALVLEVVNGMAGALVFHAVKTVDLVKKYRCKRRLPVVRMNDVGTLVGFQHELESRLGKEGHPHMFVGITIVGAALEKIILRVRIDKIAFPAMHKAEPDRARNSAAVPGYPQVVIGWLQPPDVVIPHAVILGQNDLDGVAANLQFSAQAKNHICQTTDFGNRGTFRCHHHDIHSASSFKLPIRAM